MEKYKSKTTIHEAKLADLVLDKYREVGLKLRSCSNEKSKSSNTIPIFL